MVDKMHYYQIETLYPKLNEVIEAINAQDALIKEIVAKLGEKGIIEVEQVEAEEVAEVVEVEDKQEEAPVEEEVKEEELDISVKEGE